MKNRIMSITENLSLIVLSVLLCVLAVPTTVDTTFVEDDTVSVSAEIDHIPSWVWDKTWERCEYEDSNNCVWNAKRMGLGGGTSYIATSKKRIIYVEHYEAYRLTHHIIRLVYAP